MIGGGRSGGSSFSAGSELSSGIGADRTTAANDGKALTDHVRSETLPASVHDRSTLDAIQSMEATRGSNVESAPVQAMLEGVSLAPTNQSVDSPAGYTQNEVAAKDLGTRSSGDTRTLSSGDTVTLSPNARAGAAKSPWDEAVAKYTTDGTVEIKSVPGIAQSVRQSTEIGVGNRGEVYQAADPSKVIKEGDFHEIVAQSAAFTKLRTETNFVVPNSTVLVDPEAPGKAFLEMDKLAFHKPGQLYEMTSPYRQELTEKANAVLKIAEAVIGQHFISDLKVEDNWGVVDSKATMDKLDKNRPLAESDIAIYDPVSYFAMQK